MKRWHVAAAVLIGLFVVVVGVSAWASYVDSLNAIKHETSRWAVIEDVNGDRMAVEPESDQIWAELVQLNQNGTRMFVGGIVERYDNKWGFCFKRDSVTIAQFTAEFTTEGLQGTIEYISTHIDEWVGGWGYVSSRVVEAHS